MKQYLLVKLKINTAIAHKLNYRKGANYVNKIFIK